MKFYEYGKIENEEQYHEVSDKITKLLDFVNDDTPMEESKLKELMACCQLIEDYDKKHYIIAKPSPEAMRELRL